MAKHQPNRKNLNTTQAAGHIGRSPGAVRNLVMRRQIPYRKVAGRLVFFSDELDFWLDNAPGLRVENVNHDRKI